MSDRYETPQSDFQKASPLGKALLLLVGMAGALVLFLFLSQPAQPIRPETTNVTIVVPASAP